MKTTCILLLILSAYLLPLNAGSPSDIVGLWITPDNKSIIQIEYEQGRFTGKILRINPGVYMNEAAPKDVNNKEPGLRSRSLEGLIILTGITYKQSKKKWDIERIYEPEKGKFYEGYITLDGKDELFMRGHVPGKKWLGRTEVWRRVEGVVPF